MKSNIFEITAYRLSRLAFFVFDNMKKIMNTSNFIQVSMRVVTVLFCIKTYAQSENYLIC